MYPTLYHPGGNFLNEKISLDWTFEPRTTAFGSAAQLAVQLACTVSRRLVLGLKISLVLI